MNVPPAFSRRLHWINLPTVALIALLQRTPVVRVVVVIEDFVLASRIGTLLKSTFATSAALGAVHSLAGATALSASQPAPLNVQVGSNVSVGFAITGTLSEPESWTVGGTVPPGLSFNGGVTSGVISSAQLLLSGSPTTAGQFTISLQAHDVIGGNTPVYSYAVNVTGAAATPPGFTAHPQSQMVTLGGNATLSITATGTPAPALQWRQNGVDVAGGTSATLALNNFQPASTGLYAAVATNSAGSASSNTAIMGLTTTSKVVGAGQELQPVDIVHPNGNVFDQVLLTGTAEAITADVALNQVTRTSYIDLDNDIVQVEFSGPGTLSLVLDEPSGPAAPQSYTQQVNYMKGHARIVITGADQRTNVSVFTVGRATAFDPTGAFNIIQPISATNNPANNGSPLFQGHAGTTYDGIADIAVIAISSTNGRFGGIRTANAHYFARAGMTGVYAPGVTFEGPVFMGDITAVEAAKPVIVLGSAADTRITGGDLSQTNGEAVEVSGITQLRFVTGSDSHGNIFPAVPNQAVLRQNGQDVTSQIVVNP